MKSAKPNDSTQKPPTNNNDEVKAQERDENTETMRVPPGEAAPEAPTTRTSEQVRQGRTGSHVRYVLLFSIAGAVIAVAAIFAIMQS